MPTKQLYRLKAGTHHVGGLNGRKIKAGRPGQDLLESDRNLALEEPDRWEKYDGPPPGGEDGEHQFGISGDTKSPGPPNDAAAALARMLKPRSNAEREALAAMLERQAEELRGANKESDKNSGGGEMSPTTFPSEPEPNLQPLSRAALIAAGEDVPAAPTVPSETSEGDEPEDLQSLNKGQLIEVAQREGVEVNDSMKKADILSAIEDKRNRG